MFALRRFGALLVVLLGTASAVLLVSAAAAPAPGALTLTVSGPTAVVGIPAPRYVVMATIANTTDSDATGLTISSSFPDSDAREEITGVGECDDSGLNLDVCTVPDVPAGQSRIVTFRYAPTEYGVDRHHVVAASDGLSVTDEADHDVRIKWPAGTTDWRVAVTPAVGMGGLRARHEVIVTNVGPTTATNVVLDEQLQAGEQLVTTSLGDACTLPTAVVLHCSLGSMAGGASFTLVVDTKLPPNPTDTFHAVDVGSDTPSVSAEHLLGSGPAVDGWRYWLCASCTPGTFADGYEIPNGFVIRPDETVHLADGSLIRRDGVIDRADGKLVLTDGTVTSPPASPPGVPTGVTAAAADGQATVSFAEPSSNGWPIRSYTVTANPGGYVYSGDSSPITAIGLANGTSYTFTVSASSAAGPGPASAPSNAVTPLAVPAAPTDVTAEGSDRQGTVSFTPTPSGTVAYYTATAFPGGRTANGTTTPITVSGLKNGNSYTFTVTATNSSGTGPDSAESNTVVPADQSRLESPPPPPDPRAPVPEPPPAAGPRPRLPGN